MLRIKSFNNASLYPYDEIEIKDEIFNTYKYALVYIGVNFEREDVQDALLISSTGMEDALRTTIAYWYWKEEKKEEFDYPSAFLIQALEGQWKPYNWKDSYLDNPNIKNPCLIWWNDAAREWGQDFRNKWVVDVSDNSGEIMIEFATRNRISLGIAKRWGWQRLKEYVLEQSKTMQSF
jgi:hypothetical protein